jgi:hypothetical protein
MNEINEKNLIKDVENAFSDTQYPRDDNLVFDNNNNYSDVIETKQDFLGKHWKNLSIDIINHHRDDLPVLTPEAFCFYLPAFLIASISYPIQIIDVLPNNLILDVRVYAE